MCNNMIFSEISDLIKSVDRENGINPDYICNSEICNIVKNFSCYCHVFKVDFIRCELDAYKYCACLCATINNHNFLNLNEKGKINLALTDHLKCMN